MHCLSFRDDTFPTLCATETSGAGPGFGAQGARCTGSPVAGAGFKFICIVLDFFMTYFLHFVPQKLQEQVQGLEHKVHDVQARLLRAQDSAEKLRTENQKKKEQVDKMEKTISQMEDRIRNLEIRGI
jgi:hypothetical protein